MTSQYWNNAPATVNGVLGGMEHVHEDDIRESRAFLESLDGVGRERALDCAAGPGCSPAPSLIPPPCGFLIVM
jgi:protein N-terminal methyltransferase